MKVVNIWRDDDSKHLCIEVSGSDNEILAGLASIVEREEPPDRHARDKEVLAAMEKAKQHRKNCACEKCKKARR